MPYYAGKSAIVTGGASGLGLALADGMLRAGARVALLDVDESGLQRAAARLSHSSSRLSTFRADVTDLESFSMAVTAAQATLGTIDLFFNNAGIGGTLPFAEADIRHWRRIVELNLFGVIHGTTLAYRAMKPQGAGHVVNISSISGLIPIPGQALYNTTKYAVAGLTQSLQHELRSEGIRLSLICPGMVRTDIFYKPILGEPVAPDPKRIPRNALDASDAAARILKAVARKKELIILPTRERIAFVLCRLCPATLSRTFRRIAAGSRR